jgi:hypothetical protein
MRQKSIFVAFGIAIAAGFVSAASATDRDDDRTGERGGSVVRCSLDGVNPAVHPKIFGNVAVARSYGFVKAPDGSWHVMANCR